VCIESWSFCGPDKHVHPITLSKEDAGYHFLNRDVIFSFRRLFLICASAYVALTVPAIIIDHQYNTINRHYLDKRGTDVYVATNVDALASFSRSDARLKAHMGPDLVSLANDPEFQETLRNGKFYKQNFDEPFQIFGRAVMFGYKIEPRSGLGRPIFHGCPPSSGAGTRPAIPIGRSREVDRASQPRRYFTFAWAFRRSTQ
jgi:hypothetical protein